MLSTAALKVQTSKFGLQKGKGYLERKTNRPCPITQGGSIATNRGQVLVLQQLEEKHGGGGARYQPQRLESIEQCGLGFKGKYVI